MNSQNIRVNLLVFFSGGGGGGGWSPSPQGVSLLSLVER